MTDAIDVLGIDHVQLAMPRGGEEEARAFYAGVLGLREVAKPAALRDRGGCWFAAPGVALHLGVDANFVAAGKAHPALVVWDLRAAREALTSHGVAIVEDDADIGVARCYVSDPFGNRLELVDARDAAFTSRGER
jgi:catechol 2,3-dioxygenase-like lactoylglutathione lyase family enzyme